MMLQVQPIFQYTAFFAVTSSVVMIQCYACRIFMPQQCARLDALKQWIVSDVS